jgi:hypothetical protein
LQYTKYCCGFLPCRAGKSLVLPASSGYEYRFLQLWIFILSRKNSVTV